MIKYNFKRFEMLSFNDWQQYIREERARTTLKITEYNKTLNRYLYPPSETDLKSERLSIDDLLRRKF